MCVHFKLYIIRLDKIKDAMFKTTQYSTRRQAIENEVSLGIASNVFQIQLFSTDHQRVRIYDRIDKFYMTMHYNL